MADEKHSLLNRRDFLRGNAGVLGAAALSQLLPGAAQSARCDSNAPGVGGFPQFAPKARRVIFLFQGGGPSQIDLLDHKPMLQKFHGKDLPKSVKGDAMFTGMVNGQSSFPVVASPYKFKRHGQSGAWVSDLMPNFAKVVDEVCIINSMTTPQVDHDAAITYLQTGIQFAGRPSVGAWASYGLGSECADLPAFVVLMSDLGNAFLSDRHWGAGFLPSRHQGVKFGAGKEPVKYLNNPGGINGALRRHTLDDLRKLNGLHHDVVGDPEIQTRISQYEMAYRMQMSVPELTNIADEPDSTFALYGEDARKSGTMANCALLARRLTERGVRFVQVFQRGWDHHSNLPKKMPELCEYSDRANAALLMDLKQRGLLEDTLVIWGGEFGRTVFCQGKLEADNFGREHHGLCFTMWLAGAGIKPGLVYGSSDDWSFHVAANPVTIHDLYATIFHQLGINHEALTFRFQGRDYRLTDLYGNVVKPILT